MRPLSKSVIVALIATAALYATLLLVLPSSAWFKVFLFERSFTQWVALGMFVFGLDQLTYRWRVARTETHLLARTVWPPATPETSPPPGQGWVGPRLATLGEVVRHHSPAFTKNTAKSLAEEDARTLNEAYSLSSDVVGLLPLVGFFGTVLGLSQGLYNNFVLQGEDSTSSFANAIGTAFDTTLLALFLTILLSVLQSLIRRTEQSVLERLERFVEQQLVHLELTGSPVVPASNDPRIWLHELGIHPAELIGFLRDKLGHMASHLDTVASSQDRLLTTLHLLETAAREARVQPAPDPSPQLEAMAEILRDIRQRLASDAPVRADVSAALDRVESLLQAQLPPYRQLLQDLHESTQAGAQSSSLQAAEQQQKLTQLAHQLAEQHTAIQAAAQSATQTLAAVVKDGTAQTVAALASQRTENADLHVHAVNQLNQALTAHHTEQQAATRDLAAAVRDAASQTAAGLSAQQAENSRQHHTTQELLRRPKTFSVTEQPAADDGA